MLRPFLKELPFIISLFLITAIPFINSSLTHLSFELPKALAIQVGGLLTLLMTLLLGPKKVRFSRKYLYFSSTVLIATILVSVLGISPTQSFWGSYYRRAGIITLLGILALGGAINIFLNSKLHQGKKETLSLLIVISNLSVSIQAIHSFVAANFLKVPQLLSDGRIVTTFGHPNFLAGFLVATAPFYLTHKKLKWLLPVNFLAVGLTFSRGAYLALIIGAFFWLVLKKSRQQQIRILAVVSLAVILIYMAGFTIRVPFFYKHTDNYQLSRIAVLFDPYKWGGEPRFKVYEKAVEAILKKPLLGYGVDNQNLAFSTVNASEELHYLLKGYSLDKSHNEVLDILLQGGLLLLLTYFFVIKGAFSKPNDPKDKITPAIKTGLIIILFRGLINVNSLDQYLYFWLFLSLIFSGPLERKVEVKHKWPAGLATLIVTVFISYFALKQYQADIHYKGSIWSRVNNLFDQEKELKDRAFDTFPVYRIYKN